jgi:hypothetical protein
LLVSVLPLLSALDPDGKTPTNCEFSTALEETLALPLPPFDLAWSERAGRIKKGSWAGAPEDTFAERPSPSSAKPHPLGSLQDGPKGKQEEEEEEEEDVSAAFRRTGSKLTGMRKVSLIGTVQECAVGKNT